MLFYLPMQEINIPYIYKNSRCKGTGFVGFLYCALGISSTKNNVFFNVFLALKKIFLLKENHHFNFLWFKQVLLFYNYFF